jgi:Fic family protein
MEYIEYDLQFNILSINRLSNIVTKGVRSQTNLPYPKGFKKKEVIVNNQRTTPPKDVEKELKNLINFYKINKDKIHPLEMAFRFHSIYERIHPFIDANGRTGRFIMNKILMNNNYFPIIIYKANTRGYHNALKHFIADNKKNKYYEFMVSQSSKTYKTFLKILERI